MSEPRKYLVIDTETSGLFDFSQPADADGQPRMASLAMIGLREDLTEDFAVQYFVKPEGWAMNEEAAKINGLSMEHLNEVGVSVRVLLDSYLGYVDDGHVVVAFNSQFDTKVLRGELRRAKLDDRFEKTPTICTMRASTDIVKMPKAGKPGYKFPKLAEACKHFGIVNEGAHSALHDARACAEILRRLVAMKRCPEPKVFFAKERP